jgi:hypothetical protein
MQPLINEWQLGTKLNQALQHQHRADFSLWLALLSPAIEEMAAFLTPVSEAKPANPDLYRALGLVKNRSFGWQPHDATTLHQQSVAVQQSLAQLKLHSYLQPEPWVLQEDPRKLDAQIIADLDAHCRRRLSSATLERPATDETALFEILEQLADEPFFTPA